MHVFNQTNAVDRYIINVLPFVPIYILTSFHPKKKKKEKTYRFVNVIDSIKSLKLLVILLVLPEEMPRAHFLILRVYGTYGCYYVF